MHTFVYKRRMMVFVDGTNFLVELAKEIGVDFRAEKPPNKGIELAAQLVSRATSRRKDALMIRSYWFASYRGDDAYGDRLASAVRSATFEPVLFRKKRGREKGVDIALAKEMLVNAFNRNMELAFLVAGDEDYVGLVSEVKRYGVVVLGAFFEHGLANPLRLAFDSFEPMSAEVTLGSKGVRTAADEIRAELAAPAA